MLFIILYNTMVIASTIFMLLVAFKLKRIWKLIVSPIMIIAALTVFVIPNISFFQAPFAAPFKIVVTDGERPLEEVTVITARGLEFISGMAHIPQVTWKSVGVGLTNINGEIVFKERIKFMNINMGWPAEWRDNNDVLILALKDNYIFKLSIDEPKSTYTIKLTKNTNSIPQRDKELYEYFMAKNIGYESSRIMKSYYLNNVADGGRHE